MTRSDKDIAMDPSADLSLREDAIQRSIDRGNIEQIESIVGTFVAGPAPTVAQAIASNPSQRQDYKQVLASDLQTLWNYNDRVAGI